MSHRRKRFRLLVTVLSVGIIGATVWAPFSASGSDTRAASTSATSFTNVPIAGTFGSGGTFRGTMDITRFATQDGTLSAVGTVTGVFRNSAGDVVKRVVDAALSLPVTAASATCRILHLELGPLDLDLLGLHVHLNKVVLDITATQGPGELLGNLLCALAHLLDGSTLNSVLGQLLTAVVKITRILSLVK